MKGTLLGQGLGQASLMAAAVPAVVVLAADQG